MLDMVGWVAVAPDLQCHSPAPTPGGRVPTYDAQITGGATQPLPGDAAVDGVEGQIRHDT